MMCKNCGVENALVTDVKCWHCGHSMVGSGTASSWRVIWMDEFGMAHNRDFVLGTQTLEQIGKLLELGVKRVSVMALEQVLPREVKCDTEVRIPQPPAGVVISSIADSAHMRAVEEWLEKNEECIAEMTGLKQGMQGAGPRFTDGR